MQMVDCLGVVVRWSQNQTLLEANDNLHLSSQSECFPSRFLLHDSSITCILYHRICLKFFDQKLYKLVLMRNITVNIEVSSSAQNIGKQD